MVFPIEEEAQRAAQNNVPAFDPSQFTEKKPDAEQMPNHALIELMEARQIYINVLHSYVQDMAKVYSRPVEAEDVMELVAAEHQLGHAHYSFQHSGNLMMVLKGQERLLAVLGDIVRGDLSTFEE